MPPAIIDVDRDGTKDYIVMILEDGESGRRALLVREWGETAEAFGRTVFYVIIEDDNDGGGVGGAPAARPAGPRQAVTALPPGSASPPTSGSAITWKTAGRSRRRLTGSTWPSTTVTAAPASRTAPRRSFISRCSGPGGRASIRPARSAARSPSWRR